MVVTTTATSRGGSQAWQKSTPVISSAPKTITAPTTTTKSNPLAQTIKVTPTAGFTALTGKKEQVIAFAKPTPTTTSGSGRTVGTPTSAGYSTAGGGTTQPTAMQDNIIRNIAGVQLAKEQLARQEQLRQAGIRAQELLKIQQVQQTRIPSQFEQAYTKTNIERSQKGYSTNVGITDVTRSAEKRNISTSQAGRASTYIAEQNIQIQHDKEIAPVTKSIKDEVIKKMESDFKSYQDRINAGEDFNKVKAEWEQQSKVYSKEYIDKVTQAEKQWLDTRGASLSQQAQKAILGQASYLNFKEAVNIKNRAKNFGSGVVTGLTAGIWGEQGIISSVKRGDILGAGTGIAGLGLFVAGRAGSATVGTALTAVGLFSSIPIGTYYGTKEYIAMKKAGFSNLEAKQYGLAKGTAVGMKTIDTTAGVVTGAIGLSTGISLLNTGFSKLNVGRTSEKDIKVLKEAELHKNIYKDKLVTPKGITKESQVKNLNVDSSAKDLATAEIRKGNSVRIYERTFDKSKLTPEELKIVNKLPTTKIKVLVATDINGNIVRQEWIGSIKVGNLIPYKERIAGKSEGTIKENSIFGRAIETRTGKEGTIQVEEKFFRTKGTVNYELRNYEKINPRIFRKEAGITNTISTRRAIYEGGQWKRTDISLIKGSSVSRVTSRLLPKSTKLFIEATGNQISEKNIVLTDLKSGRSLLFKDSSGRISTRQSPTTETIFSIGKPPKPPKQEINRAMKPLFETPKVEAPKIEKPSTSIDIIPIKEPSFTPSVKQESIYAGTGLYEQQSLSSIQKTAPSLITPLSLVSSIQKAQLINPIPTKTFGTIVSGTLKPTLIGINKPTPTLFNSNIGVISGEKFKPAPKLNTYTGIIPIQQTGIKMEQLQPQVQQLVPTQITQPAPSTVEPLTPAFLTPFILPPFSGNVQAGGGERGERRYGGLFGGTRYSASLGSVLLRRPKKKVTEKELSMMARKKYSGFELRPEVEVVSSKGKKKKGLGLF